MNLRQNDTKRTAHTPAKLNLFLEVLGQRKDGFHDLETLMVPIRLFDTLTFQPTIAADGAPGEIDFRLRVSGDLLGLVPSYDAVPAGSANLVVRALELLRIRSGCELSARVELFKRIPSAAGLGGGSSDAAAVLALANRGWGLHWSRPRLAELAQELGSDVPYFLAPRAAICRGRGEQVEPLEHALPLDIVIVKPTVGLGTADVYRALNAFSVTEGRPTLAAHSRRSVNTLADRLRRGNLVQLGQWMGNRLQAAAAVLSPWVGHVQAAFADLDFLGHQLSGSGSAYFGVCRHAGHARRLATILKTRQLGLVYVTRSCS